MPRKPGRPTKYTPERVERILEAIRKGNTRDTAAKLAGVSATQMYEWMNKHPEFAEAIEKADAEAEGFYVGIIERAAAKSWQAAAWWLERRRAAKYGRLERHEVTGKGGEALQLQVVIGGKKEKAKA